MTMKLVTEPLAHVRQDEEGRLQISTEVVTEAIAELDIVLAELREYAGRAVRIAR